MPNHDTSKFKIRDNRHRGTVGAFLESEIENGSSLSIVSAYFTIHAFNALKTTLTGIDGLKFLFGEPNFIRSLDPKNTDEKTFNIVDKRLQLNTQLQQKPIAKECAAWIKEKVQIRTTRQSNLLHGKMYPAHNYQQNNPFLKDQFGYALLNRAAVYRIKGEYDRAIADCNRAIELDPGYAEPYSNRGAVYRKKGEENLAIADYNKAIELKPDLAHAYNNRGNAYIQKGEIDLAIADYNRAIQLEPDLAEPYAGRGVAQLHLRAWEKARTGLTTARDMEVNIIAAFHYFYESIPDFEGKHGIQLPPDIAAILTPQQA